MQQIRDAERSASPTDFFRNFWKWGDPSASFHLSDFPKFKDFLEKKWNIVLRDDLNFQNFADTVGVFEKAGFSETDFTSTFPALRIDQFSNSPEDRFRCGFGKSYHDIIRILTGNFPPLADFVLFPETDIDVENILTQASQKNISIIPYGGGSNVVGAFDLIEKRKSCYVNLQRMNKLLAIDDVSHTATFETGIFGPELEKILNENGFTLGHFPQSFEFSTLGGWLATRSGGQESGQYGKIEDIVLGIKAVTPQGIIQTKIFPRHAGGIDTHHLFIGSEGTLGIITQATLRIHRLSEKHQWVVALFKTFDEGINAVRKLIQGGIHPGIMRLSDPLETKLFSTMRSAEAGFFKNIFTAAMKSYIRKKGFHEPCILMMRFTEMNDADDAAVKNASDFIKQKNGFLLPSSSAGNWEEHRFTLPYLRDTLIEHHILIDTFETVALWKDVSKLYAEVKSAFAASDFLEKGGLLFCHISHVYTTGACLYFTMIIPQEKNSEEEQWKRYKKIATDAIVAADGAVSHHHGVGNDHRQWYLQTLDKGERELLQAIKQHLDPQRIMNPGKLFDPYH